MVRYRTINECVDIIKELDKDTAITIYFIRRLVADNQINFRKTGTKVLVDFDSLSNFLQTA